MSVVGAAVSIGVSLWKAVTDNRPRHDPQERVRAQAERERREWEEARREIERNEEADRKAERQRVQQHEGAVERLMREEQVRAQAEREQEARHEDELEAAWKQRQQELQEAFERKVAEQKQAIRIQMEQNKAAEAANTRRREELEEEHQRKLDEIMRQRVAEEEAYKRRCEKEKEKARRDAQAAQQEHQRNLDEVMRQQVAEEEAYRKRLRMYEIGQVRVQRAEEELARRVAEHQARIAKEWPPPPAFAEFKQHINVAFIGATGTGKSSMINLYMGVRNGAPGSAPTDIVECTKQATPYSCDRLTLWDFPGAGTLLFPRATYIKQIGLRYFDAVVIINATRFTEIEVELFREARVWEIPCYMLWNKADEALQQEERNKGVEPQVSFKRLKANLQEVLQDELRKLGGDADALRDAERRSFVVTTWSDMYPQLLGPEMQRFLQSVKTEIRENREKSEGP